MLPGTLLLWFGGEDPRIGWVAVLPKKKELLTASLGILALSRPERGWSLGKWSCGVQRLEVYGLGDDNKN